MSIVNADAKSCSRCKVKKTLINFALNKLRKDGHNNECKECYNERYRIRTPDSKRYTKFGGTTQEYMKIYSANHYQRNKGYYRNKCAIRERNLKQATPTWSISFFIEEAYELSQRRTKVTGLLWEVDHIIPIVNKNVCGLHVEHNLQVVPTTWNKQKSNKWDCEKGVQTWLS